MRLLNTNLEMVIIILIWNNLINNNGNMLNIIR
jgi:hypothetical protein